MKEKIGAYPYLYPVPIVLIGTESEDKVNYTTVGDIAIMGIKVPLICISLGEKSLARHNVLCEKIFSVNIPSTTLLAEVDFCGMQSGRNFAKDKLFTTQYGDSPHIPLIKECPVNMECHVIHDFQHENRHIFIAKVLQTHIDKQFVSNENGRRKVADLSQLNPIIYALDNKYYEIGNAIGIGYQEGKDLKDKLGMFE